MYLHTHDTHIMEFLFIRIDFPLLSELKPEFVTLSSALNLHYQ